MKRIKYRVSAPCGTGEYMSKTVGNAVKQFRKEFSYSGKQIYVRIAT